MKTNRGLSVFLTAVSLALAGAMLAGVISEDRDPLDAICLVILCITSSAALVCMIIDFVRSFREDFRENKDNDDDNDDSCF